MSAFISLLEYNHVQEINSDPSTTDKSVRKGYLTGKVKIAPETSLEVRWKEDKITEYVPEKKLERFRWVGDPEKEIKKKSSLLRQMFNLLLHKFISIVERNIGWGASHDFGLHFVNMSENLLEGEEYECNCNSHEKNMNIDQENMKEGFPQVYEKYRSQLVELGKTWNLSEKETTDWYNLLQGKSCYHLCIKRALSFNFDLHEGSYSDFRPELLTIAGFSNEFERVKPKHVRITAEDISRMFQLYEVWFSDEGIIDEDTFFIDYPEDSDFKNLKKELRSYW
jgi:hypothetical protein